MSRSLPRSQPASADEVIALVRERCRPLSTERVSLRNARGRVLREPVCAPEDQPAFDRSSVDGYAVRLDDPGPRFRIVAEVRAGEWKPRALGRGEAVRIATGGALPCDGLQVVMKEQARVAGTSLRLVHRDAESNIRRRGQEARRGQVLIEPGTVLHPGALGLLASLGHTRPRVTRRPRVLHVATGNELVPPDAAPGPGQIRDSNSTLVRAFLQQWQIEPQQLRLPEDEASTLEALRELLPAPGAAPGHPAVPRSRSRREGGPSVADKPPGDAAGPEAAERREAFDLVLISGGASVGEHDFTARILRQLGCRIVVSRTNTRPGKPLLVAWRGPMLAFGLPGNPLAHFVCLNLYVRAALAAGQGLSSPPLFRQGLLAEDLPAGAHPRETFWPAIWEPVEGVARLTPLPWASSGDLTPLARANALLRVRPATVALPRGASIEFVPTSYP
jgi:molybdopterin molybdotransferase